MPKVQFNPVVRMTCHANCFTAMICIYLLYSLQTCKGQSLLKESQNSFNHRGSISKCSTIDCSMEPMRSICGTDGRTYGSRCELLRATCEGHSVQLKHKGKCQEKFRCWVERANAQKVALGQITDIFVPQCNEDGSYTEVQCHAATGYCWCATKSGQPLRGSSVRNRRPKCNGARPANLNTKRGNVGRQHPKQRCKHEDRKSFNKNLVEIFVAEYNRVSSFSRNGLSVAADPIMDSLEKRAVDWKFSELDKNGNHYLERKEIKTFRRMMKKIVNLRACAKRFSFFCDQDKNRRISQSEWTICLGVGMNKEGTETSGRDGHQMTTSRKDDIQPAAHWKKETTSLQIDDDNMPKLAEEEPLDCFAERQTQQELQKNSQHVVYIPECAPDGKYAQVQCYKSTGYCWCVDHETGKPITGTSVLNMKPDCEKLIKADRPIKGCPEKKKRKFALDFVDFLHKEMIAALNQSSPATGTNNQEQNLVDSIALWKFENLDTNSNRVLDRKEWRTFRKELKKRKLIRKCGRNFVKFCDDNNDKRITNDEWLECFSVLKERKNNIPKRSKMGENPLDKYLKND